MRDSFRVPDRQLRLVLDRRRFVRWVYVARLSVAAAIYLGAQFSWQDLLPRETQIASLVFAAAMLFTALSAWRTESRAAPVGDGFVYVQHLFDAFLVTSIVHVTGGEESQFAALFILVNTSAALLLPVGGSLLLAILGCVLYAADVLLASGAPMTSSLALQLAVFFMVALGTALIGARLKAMSSASQELADQLTRVRLQAADILRNIRSGIVTVDDGGVLIYANPAASRLLHTDLDTYLGRPLTPLLEAASSGLAAAVHRALHDGRHAQQEEAMLTVGDRSLPIGITTTSNVIDADQGGRSVTVIVQDISDQRRLGEFRRRAERLEAVAELSASLAHEIKNPLASIRSAVEQLGRSTQATPDEQTLARLIVRESDRLSRLLSEFLDFARTRVTRIGSLDLTAVAEGAVRLVMAHPARGDDIDVQVDAPVGPVPVDGDEDLLHRAIFNLTLNAVQASHPGGIVRVIIDAPQRGPLPPGIVDPTDAVAIVVADDGPGISDEVRDRLFEPFTTTRPGGSGLGLSVVHRAVEAHRGIVLVDSTGTGTTFRLVLPRRQGAAIDFEGGSA
jgi:two-component system, NtrC family, sensor histidine kinase PilS